MSVIWTPLPAGRRADGAAVLSVLVSPRLTDDSAARTTLAAFGPFADWPATLRGLSPAVAFDGGADIPVVLADPAALSSDLWRAMFPVADTAVAGHVPENFSAFEITTFPVLAGRDALHGLYADCAHQYALGPPDSLEDISALQHDHPAVWDIATQVVAFQQPRPPAFPVSAPGADPAALLEFHELVAALGDHPAVMRRLGLLFDVVIPATALPDTGATIVAFRAHLDAGDVIPRVSAQLDAATFAASPLSARLLTLRDEGHGIVEVDVDGALRKLDAMVAPRGPAAPDSPTTAALPATRSAGLSIVITDRGQALLETVVAQHAMETALATGTAPNLSADQLIRGYAIDVHDGTAWRSLCRRRGAYHFARAPTLDFAVTDAEGWVQLGVTAHDGDGGATLRVHESLARWEGWSLVAPRPGNALSHLGEANAPIERPVNAPVTSTQMSVEWAAEPRTLPALRFGRGYRMRARAVDLAGRALGLDEADDSQALPADGTFVYRRAEPVPAPIPVLTAPLSPTANPGESSSRLVLRIDNPSPDRDATAPGVSGGPRHLVPPRASVSLAETHGMLDDDAGRPRADLYATLRDRDGAPLGVDPDQPAIVVAGDRIVVPYLPDPFSRGVAVRNLPGTTDGTICRPEAGGGLLVETVPGADVRPGSVTLIPWTFVGEWPAAVGITIDVADGEGPPAWDPALRRLTVNLPRASITRIALSSYLAPGDVDRMAVWGWLREYLDGQPLPTDLDTSLGFDELQRELAPVGPLAQLAVEGGHWMLSPPRELVLVSAVRQPLGRPAFGALSAVRDLGSTAVGLAGTATINGSGTSRVELLAEWSEPVDRADGDPPLSEADFSGTADALILPEVATKPTPVAVPERGPAKAIWDGADRLEFAAQSFQPGEAPVQPVHELHDTRHRMISYRARATTRFREYFPPDDPSLVAAAGAPGPFARDGDPVTVDVPSSARPPAPRIAYAVPTFGWDRQTDTDIRVSRRVDAGVRVFLERPWFASGTDERLGVVTLATLDPDPAISPYVSRIGRDPLVVGDRADPSLPLMPNAIESAGGLAVGELPNHLVNVDGHAVDYDAERDLWSCDIVFSNVLVASSAPYRPFVRLALARYQPHSLSGVELSPVVLLDWLQLTPDRAVLVTRDPGSPDQVQVMVTGSTYRATTTAATGSAVEVTVQERVPELPDELGWRDAETKVRLGQPAVGRGPTLLWRGALDLPAGDGPFRLLVRELEEWPSDTGTTTRTIYFDTVELPGPAAAQTSGTAVPGDGPASGLEVIAWTRPAQLGASATGSWQGHDVTLTGQLGTAFFAVGENLYHGFGTASFAPALTQTTMIEIKAAAGGEYTLTFPAPVRDPILWLGSLGSILTFDAGVVVARLAGDDGFAVHGTRVIGAARNPVREGDTLGPSDSNGTVQLRGTFNTVHFTTAPNFTGGSGEDGIFLQAGGTAAAG